MADRDQRKEQQRFYDRFVRDPEAKAFYNSPEWKHPQHGARAIKLQRTPACERCLNVAPDMVHHIIPLSECTEDQKTDQANLRALCWPCHNTTHAELDAAAKSAPKQFVSGQRELEDDDQYHYIEERGTQIERFARKFCNHWRDDKRGEPFELHPFQLEYIRPVYGFVHRETGRRLIDKLWLEQSIGTGKTPVEAIFGLHDLTTTPGAQIYSLSNTFSQAAYSFDAAKLFVKNNPYLQRLVEQRKLRVKNYEIVYTPLDSKWNLISGDGSKAGAAASLLLVDEVHQIEDGAAYKDIAHRMTKRPGSLIVLATNTAKTSNTLYNDLREQAEHTLTGGRRFNRRMFPVIWAAPPEADPSLPKTWRLANKLIDVTISEQAVQDKYNELSLTPAGMAEFRALYLGQQVETTDRWIDIQQWDACATGFTDERVKDLPLYIGIDSADHDDLLAIVKCWPSLERIYASAEFWLPRVTADKYQKSHDIRYDLWEGQGDITLIDKPTFSPDVQKRIAEQIIEVHKKTPITAVCYDRAYAEHLIATLKAADINCVPVSQGWGVSTGCRELASRLTNKTLTLAPNAVWRFCAENVRVKPDERGNYWPVKPNAKGKYAGKREMKVDGISAFVTALTRARGHDFPKPTANVCAMIINLDDDDQD